jgi:protein-arginine kinase activator protein McsA
MKTIVYVCDKCRQPKQRNELAELNAYLTIPEGFAKTQYSTRIAPKESKHICKECLQSFAMFKESTEEKPVIQPEQEIKDRLFDIMQDILKEMGVVFEE